MKGFYHIWAWQPSWSCDLDFLYTHWFPLPIDASYKIWLWLAKRFQRRRSLKLWTDGRTDGRRKDDGRTTDHGHPISSPCEPNGSGELKTINLTFDFDDLGLSKNEPLKLISGAALHLPSKFGEDRPKDLGGVGEQTNKQTNKQTLLKL